MGRSWLNDPEPERRCASGQGAITTTLELIHGEQSRRLHGDLGAVGASRVRPVHLSGNRTYTRRVSRSTEIAPRRTRHVPEHGIHREDFPAEEVLSDEHVGVDERTGWN